MDSKSAKAIARAFLRPSSRSLCSCASHVLVLAHCCFFAAVFPAPVWGGMRAALDGVGLSEGSAVSGFVVSENFNRRMEESSALEEAIQRSLEAGDHAGASKLLDQLLATKRSQLVDPLELADYLESWGVNFFSSCNSDKGELLMKEVLSIRERTLGSDDLRVANTLSNLSTLHFYFRKLKDGVELEKRALQIREKHPEARHAAGTSHRDLGILYYEQGRYKEAQDELEQSLNIFSKEVPLSGATIAKGFSYLGEVLRAQGDYDQAEERFRRALEEAKRPEIADPQLLALILSNWGGLEKDRGRYGNAELALKRSVEIASRDPADESALADWLLNLAEIHRLQGDYDLAEMEYERALELAEKHLCPGNHLLAWFYNQLAVTYSDRGKFDKAEPLYRKALEIVEKTVGPDHPLAAKSRNDLAGLLASQKRFQESEKLYLEALWTRERWLGADHPEVAETCIQLGKLALAAGKPDVAVEYAYKAVGLLERSKVYPEFAIEAHLLKATLLKRRGDERGALRSLEEALRSVERQRPRMGGGERTRSEYLERYVDLYRQTVEWQIEADNLRRAVELTEQYRARVLRDQLVLAGIDLRAHIPAEIRAALEQREDEARRRIAEVQKQIEVELIHKEIDRTRLLSLQEELVAVDREYERVQEELKGQSLAWENLAGESVDFEKIREAIPQKGLILIYQIGVEKSYLFLLSEFSEEPKALPLEIERADAAVLGVQPGFLNSQKLRKVLALEGSARERIPKLNAAWRSLIPKAFWREIESACNVIIIPDGLLHSFPFEQLVIRQGVQPAEAVYWLDDGPVVSYAPSVSALHALRNRRRPSLVHQAIGPSIVSVSDPVHEVISISGHESDGNRNDVGFDELKKEAASFVRSRLRLPRLSRSADETDQILAAFATQVNENVLALKGPEATERKVRGALPGRRFIHIAAHGIVDQNRSELFAGLLLSNLSEENSTDADNDGFLQLFEIYHLNLAADLVVLSACNSNVGTQRESEGAFALSRGFMAAGANRVIASLWPVADDSTSILMQEFFRQILSEYKAGRPIDYSTALRDAKRHIRQDERWASPFYWAPFVLIGLE